MGRDLADNACDNTVMLALFILVQTGEIDVHTFLYSLFSLESIVLDDQLEPRLQGCRYKDQSMEQHSMVSTRGLPTRGSLLQRHIILLLAILCREGHREEKIFLFGSFSFSRVSTEPLISTSFCWTILLCGADFI